MKNYVKWFRRCRVDPFPVLPYHVFVAAQRTSRKTTRKEKSQGAQAVIIFWLAFVIIIVAVFMINADTIKKNFDMFRTRISSSSGVEEEPMEEVRFIGDPVTLEQPASPGQNTPQSVTTDPAAGTQTTESPTNPQTVSPGNEGDSTERPPAQTTTPGTQTQTQQSVEVRERAVYFTQIDRDGQILQSRVIRRMPVSDSPMTDALNVLLIGPSTDEINRGILNLIPQNTRILSATVRGNTAYISFSEDFMFNTFGIEGIIAQLRQIVWTVTEFQNVNDVQILIEGRRLDYLGEGIWIGSPINRQSF